MACIYKITNLVNGKMYIGQTRRRLKDRWAQHKRSARDPRGGWNKQHIHNAMSKHGIENFTIECVEECAVEELDERETYWINRLDTFRKGYNEIVGGKRPLKFRKHLKELNLEALPKKYKAVLQYTIQGEFVKEHLSIRQAACVIGINKNNIAKCCNGKHTTAGGFLWCYKGDEDSIKPLPFGRKLPNRSKTVIALRESGDVITFPNCNEAAKSVGGEWDAM